MGRFFRLLIAFGLFGVSAQAQMLTNPVQDYINKTTLLNNILSNQRAIEMSQRAQTNGQGSNRPGAGQPTRPQPGPVQQATKDATKFSPSATSVLPKLLAEKTGGDAAKQRQSEQFFQSLLGLYDQTAKKDGFPSNDVAYAFEYFVVNSYMIYHDLHEVDYNKDPRIKRGKDSLDRLRLMAEKKAQKVTITQERAVYQQLKTMLSGNAEVKKMSERQKQELTELLAIMFGVNLTAYMKGVNSEDQNTIEQSHQMAKNYLEKLIGSPIDRIKIGDDGLRQ